VILAIISVRFDTLSIFVLMSKELCDSPLKIKIFVVCILLCVLYKANTKTNDRIFYAPDDDRTIGVETYSVSNK
jgi:hypothetical protein